MQTWWELYQFKEEGLKILGKNLLSDCAILIHQSIHLFIHLQNHVPLNCSFTKENIKSSDSRSSVPWINVRSNIAETAAMFQNDIKRLNFDVAV